MNNWLKGLLYAVIFFVIVGVFSSFSEGSSGEAGENFGKLFLMVLIGIMGFWSGYNLFNKKRKRKEKEKMDEKQKPRDLTKQERGKIKKFQKKDGDDFLFMLKAVSILLALALVYFLIRWIF